LVLTKNPSAFGSLQIVKSSFSLRNPSLKSNCTFPNDLHCQEVIQSNAVQLSSPSCWTGKMVVSPRALWGCMARNSGIGSLRGVLGTSLHLKQARLETVVPKSRGYSEGGWSTPVPAWHGTKAFQSCSYG
jgi:hypothetical protein